MVKAKSARQTPMMLQYQNIKQDHPDVLLFYRMGDFYELFDEDARVASQLLNITLTSRNKGDDAIPMAGVPCHSVDDYIKKLVDLGRRVAICEQLEDPSQTKGIVKRGVVRVITPGTLTENFLSDSSSHLLSVVKGHKNIYMAWCDVSTGEVAFCEATHENFSESLVGLNIAEVVYPDETELVGSFDCVTKRPAWQFHVDEGKNLLSEIFGQGLVSSTAQEWSNGLWSALSGLFHYLKETQKEKLIHLKPPEQHRLDDCLVMDANTARSLDLIENSRSGQKMYSLYWVLNKCHSAAGRRLLQKWIAAPLVDPQAIHQRQRAFDELMNVSLGQKEISQALSRVLDIERLLGRISLNRGNPRDLQALTKSLQVLDDVEENWNDQWQSNLLVTLKEKLSPLKSLVDYLTNHLNEEVPINLADGGVIADGVDSQLDELRQLKSQAHKWLAEYQAKEIEQTGLTHLRVTYNRVFGYTIELPRRDADKAPDHFKRQQTLKNAERYVTVELKEFESKITSAKERGIEREKEIYKDLISRVLEHLNDIQEKSEALAQLDVFFSLTHISQLNGWQLPQLTEGQFLDIAQGRHPIVESTLERGEFIANDLHLDETQTLMMLTGPNMAGKSTYIRQSALIVIMAQMGMPVPAKEMKWSIVDRIYTRIGSSDELAKGQSTFMVEMAECAYILRSATQRSLIIFDEVGRGTSTLDGLAIARSIVEYLATKMTCRTLFATHYHELTQLADSYHHIVNANVLVREWGHDIVFLHQVALGATDRSYGVHVAKLAGVPNEILERAQQLLLEIKPEAMWKSQSGEQQLELFTSNKSVIEEKIKETDINSLTPIQAIQFLDQLKQELLNE